MISTIMILNRYKIMIMQFFFLLLIEAKNYGNTSSNSCEIGDMCGLCNEAGNFCCCDSSCEFYGDCCYDYVPFCKQPTATTTPYGPNESTANEPNEPTPTPIIETEPTANEPTITLENLAEVILDILLNNITIKLAKG